MCEATNFKAGLNGNRSRLFWFEISECFIERNKSSLQVELFHHQEYD